MSLDENYVNDLKKRKIKKKGVFTKMRNDASIAVIPRKSELGMS